MYFAPLLYRKQHRLSIARPSWLALPVIDRRCKLPAILSVRVDQPHMRIFHRGFQIGQSALGRLVDEGLPVRRIVRPVLGTLGGGRTRKINSSCDERKQGVNEKMHVIK